MKTPISILHEVLDKINLKPDFECSYSLPEKPQFGYRCMACGMEVMGIGKSKREAKQYAARLMLCLLAKKGYPVPPPYGFEDEPDASAADYIYTPMLKEFCAKFKLDLSYELVGETNLEPPHRTYTVRVYVGQIERRVIAHTRKTAQELGAKFMFAHLKLMYGHFALESLAKEGQAVKEPGLQFECVSQLTAEQKEDIMAYMELARPRRSHSPERVMMAVTSKMNLSVVHAQLQRSGTQRMELIELRGCTPRLVFNGNTRGEAAYQALQYLELAFLHTTMKE